jgi:hypothetical protein
MTGGGAHQRVAAMMDAEAIKATPVLEASPGPAESGEVEPEVEEWS